MILSSQRIVIRAASVALASLASAACAPTGAPMPRGASYILNIDLSHNGPDLAASVPEIAIDPRYPRRVAVMWRAIAMSTEPQTSSRRSICHLSISRDGGASFTNQMLDWGMSDTPQCNAPYVDFAANGDMFIGATLAAKAPLNPPEGFHAFGRAVIRKSQDGGRTWSPTASVIATDSGERFGPNPAIPEAAKRTPWDGARGVVDRSTGAIYVSAGYPAPPGGESHSQRFYAVSRDGGATWSMIRALGSQEWPQRWDSRIIAAHGRMAVAYIAAATPRVDDCLCVVFATSSDEGVTLDRTLVTQATHVDMLVHYPPLAAHPSRRGVYAIALISEDRTGLDIFATSDGGATWRKLDALKMPADVTRASRPTIAFGTDGTLVVMWRGQRSDGSFDLDMAASPDGQGFGPPVRVSSASSRTPDQLASDYAVRGDFITALKADAEFAHAAWTDWRTGAEARVYYGRVPLARLAEHER